MATQKQIDANRRNAQKSTGPRTEDGKKIARLNALKHGMRTEEFYLLPSEDPAAFAERLNAWNRDYEPANEAERELVTQAATLSWRIERAHRIETVTLSRLVGDAVGEAKHARDERQDDASKRLIPRADQAEGLPIDPVPADRLIAELEATDDGCRWLRDRWVILGKAVCEGKPWTPYQEMVALRMLRQGPAVIRDPKVLDVVVAARMLRGESETQSSEGSVPIDPDSWDGGGPLARLGVDRTAAWRAWEHRPADREQALTLLANVAAWEVARLEALEAERLEGFDAELGEAADLASFDAGPEGERVRRHLAALQRQLLKTLDQIGKLRLQAVKLRLDEAKLQKATNEAKLKEGDLQGRAGGVSPLSGSTNKDKGAQHDERTQFDRPSEEDRGLTPRARQETNARHDERTQARIEDRGLTPPARQETNARQEAIEPNSEAGARQIARFRRDQWPLETIKRRRKAERKARRQAQAGGSKR